MRTASIGLLAILALGGCECDEADPEGPGDVARLVGEGPFEDVDAGDEAGTPESGADAESPTDLSGSDLAGGDLTLPDLAPRDADAPPPDSGDPCAVEPVAELTAAEALARLDELEGEVVRVIGAASAGAATCTQDPCPGGDTCCNLCRARIALDDTLPLVGGTCTRTATVGCSGSPCEPLVCTPPAVGLRRPHVGRLRGPTASPSLEILRWVP